MRTLILDSKSIKKIRVNLASNKLLIFSLLFLSLIITDFPAFAQSPLCPSSSKDQDYEWVTRIKVDDGERTSGKVGYKDFTSSALSTLTAGKSYNIEVDVHTDGKLYNEYVKIWFDLNQDNIIQDPQELIFNENRDVTGFATFKGTITIPTTAFNGIMYGRMIMQWSGSPQLCGVYAYGTTYDLKVNIYGGATNPSKRTLSVSQSGNGNVTSLPEGIDTSKGMYSYDFNDNSSVTLKATPEQEYNFKNWSGDVANNSNIISVTMNSAKSIHANFTNPLAVFTTAVSKITINSALTGGEVISDGTYPVLAKGTVWNTTGNPTIADNKTEDGEGIGAFTSNITGLSPNTTYLVRAYATNSQRTSYGNEVSFKTASLDQITLNPISVSSDAGQCGAIVTFAKPSVSSKGDFSFNYFNEGEPNNYEGKEDHLQLFHGGTWNDLNGTGNEHLMYFVVEFNSIRSETFPDFTKLGDFGGHSYYVSTFKRNWIEARASARGIGGDLASINTMEENQFIASFVGDVWVGGYQDRNDPWYAEPGNASQSFGGWKWVDGTSVGNRVTLSQTSGLTSGSLFPVGKTVNTYEAKDAEGNITILSLEITVTDTEVPIALAKNITVQLNGSGIATITAAQIDNGSSDACGIKSLALSKTSFNCSNVGANEVTLTVTDNNDNVSTAKATVTVEDRIVPTIVAPANIFVNIDAGKLTASGVNLGTPQTSDNCSVDYVTNNAPSAFATGITTVTWTVKDASGNIATAIQTVTVGLNVVSVAVPSTVNVPIRTQFANTPLPNKVEVTYTDNSKEQVTVTWLQGTYNGFVAGTYQLSGNLILSANTSNLDNRKASITVIVEPNKIPTALSFSATTFKPNITASETIGAFQTTDPDDTEFNYTLVVGAGDTDNSLFEIRGDKLYLRSNNGLSGKTQFTFRVRSTDPYFNIIEKAFSLTKGSYDVAIDRLKIVNAFSPNTDGINDTWTIPELRYYNNVEIEVFDRSGVRLFHTTNPERGWDGRGLNGQILKGAFYYIVQVKDINLVKKGVVTILSK